MKTLIRTTAIALIALTAACAAGPREPSFGDRVAAEGGATAAIGQRWLAGEQSIQEGQELVEDGADDIDDGEELISDGKRKQRRGETLIAEGERMKREAEERYRLSGAAAPSS